MTSGNDESYSCLCSLGVRKPRRFPLIQLDGMINGSMFFLPDYSWAFRLHCKKNWVGRWNCAKICIYVYIHILIFFKLYVLYIYLYICTQILPSVTASHCCFCQFPRRLRDQYSRGRKVKRVLEELVKGLGGRICRVRKKNPYDADVKMMRIRMKLMMITMLLI